jgi:hypothetical protein
MARWVRGRADFWAEGDFNAACSECGRKRKASKMVKNWQGQWRCPEHNEPRQPQDFVRGVQDIQTTPWVQMQRDIDVQVCTYNGLSAIPGVGIPGCSIPGRSNWDSDYYPVYVPPVPPPAPGMSWTVGEDTPTVGSDLPINIGD